MVHWNTQYGYFPGSKFVQVILKKKKTKKNLMITLKKRLSVTWPHFFLAAAFFAPFLAPFLVAFFTPPAKPNIPTINIRSMICKMIKLNTHTHKDNT